MQAGAAGSNSRSGRGTHLHAGPICMQHMLRPLRELSASARPAAEPRQWRRRLSSNWPAHAVHCPCASKASKPLPKHGMKLSLVLLAFLTLCAAGAQGRSLKSCPPCTSATCKQAAQGRRLALAAWAVPPVRPARLGAPAATPRRVTAPATSPPRAAPPPPRAPASRAVAPASAPPTASAPSRAGRLGSSALPPTRAGASEKVLNERGRPEGLLCNQPRPC